MQQIPLYQLFEATRIYIETSKKSGPPVYLVCVPPDRLVVINPSDLALFKHSKFPLDNPHSSTYANSMAIQDWRKGIIKHLKGEEDKTFWGLYLYKEVPIEILLTFPNLEVREWASKILKEKHNDSKTITR
jgi:hypothetical protein